VSGERVEEPRGDRSQELEPCCLRHAVKDGDRRGNWRVDEGPARSGESSGRDPSTIERTIAAPAIVARDDAAKEALLASLPAERRPFVRGGTPQQAAEVLKQYVDAGFTGTPDQIALIGEVLPPIGG
jgi:hypothetical protein